MNKIDDLNWRKIITESAAKNKDFDYKFAAPVTASQELQFENKLNIKIPEELHSLYKQTNGVREFMEDIFIGDFIWPVNKVIEENREYRNNKNFPDLYMPFDNMLFFSEAGNGDLFFIPILNGKTPRFDIFVWNHEDDSRSFISPYLHNFIEGWIKGDLKI